MTIFQTFDTTRWEEWCADWQHVIPPDGENLAMLQDRIEALAISNDVVY